ncbi:uncharacterized protein LY89DRAFT_585643 [Mollisia scopiformis]|uniref:Uncharacterized protein n=1 Tax=Mollisia scopiformis TaxID=149040 RepID=A0A194X9H6_MOLSC|nr:uncharacterized protein LY89DRAFT_585643 [Mollisia scopiformis]KUJ16779.1 hypothetical protein LY89DRAFT_585643 [Mollisia scopiformis]
MALEAAGVTSRDLARKPLGSSYQGDVFAGSYLHRVNGLPDHLNSAIWMMKLRPDTQHSQIFDIIQCGSVWSLHLKLPTADHSTMAAQLAFVSPQAAAIFMHHYRTYGIQIAGNWISCIYDKHGSPGHTTSETRVLRIEGPATVMNPQFWDAKFRSACSFQLDRWGYLQCDTPGKLRMEFRFSRVDGQAQTCRQMIERVLVHYGISVWYGPDPCGQIGNNK